MYGINIETAARHLRVNDIPRRRVVKLSVADHPTLLRLKAEGSNNVQLAAYFSCSRQAVQQALQRAVRASEVD